jgi:hypothetical protein
VVSEGIYVLRRSGATGFFRGRDRFILRLRGFGPGGWSIAVGRAAVDLPPAAWTDSRSFSTAMTAAPRTALPTVPSVNEVDCGLADTWRPFESLLVELSR